MVPIISEFAIQKKELEAYILGILLLEGTKKNLNLIKSYDLELFYSKKHQKIFNAMKSLHDKREPIDLLTVMNELKAKGDLDEIGGAYYLSELTAQVSSTANFEYYLKIVYENFLLRKTHEKISEIGADTINRDAKILTVIDKIKGLQNFLSLSKVEGDIITPQSMKEERYKTLNSRRKSERILTGFPSIDKKLVKGFAPDLISAISGPTSHGKTAIKVNWIVRQCRKGLSIFSIVPEMNFEGEMDRIQTVMTGIPLMDLIRIKEWAENDPRAEIIDKNLEEIQKWGLYIDDTRGTNSTTYLNRIENLKTKTGKLDIVYIDTLEKLPDVVNSLDKQDKVIKILNDFEIFAKEVKIHLCLLVQFNRYYIHRESHIPQIGDINYGTAIDKAAHTIFAVTRKHKEDSESEDNEINLWLVKQRDGPDGKVILNWQKETTIVIDPLEVEQKEIKEININLEL
jgi:replicative DNA helicase